MKTGSALGAVVYGQQLNDNLQAFDYFQGKNNYFIWWDGGYEHP